MGRGQRAFLLELLLIHLLSLLRRRRRRRQMQQPQPEQLRPSARRTTPPGSPYLQESISLPPSSPPPPAVASTPSSPTHRTSRRLPTPPIVPQQPFLPPYLSAAPPPSATLRPRPRTVNDLAVKQCWICQDGEEEGEDPSSWVHACDCTLVAHSQVRSVLSQSVSLGRELTLLVVPPRVGHDVPAGAQVQASLSRLQRAVPHPRA